MGSSIAPTITADDLNGAAPHKTSFASDNREVAMLSLPVSRSHIPVKSRTDPCRNAGEETTYSTTYTGVDALPWAAMQMVSRADKEKSFGFVPSVPNLRHSAATPAYPLFWQERKTPSTWRTILTDLEGKPCSIALQVRVHVRGRA